ncbi:hypothetical protein [Methanogenium sp. MK-MG]|uniref:hypothetical protein n=1 Tax=Methanogenium sp. MK-MG TaxID=2599926 RepID=UPI0013E9A48C|nr:hypothetical protein [Methanogenium sp. MK-MG]KAF1078160.1 hypothetical protein MKMG_00900 [Methanogenium sp. MK-MG]
MKTLPLNRTGPNDMVKVTCAEEKEVSVYSRCAFCAHCEGVVVGRREMPNPQKQIIEDMKVGRGGDDELQNAAMTFNLFIRDGSALLCSDDKNEGFRSLYS